MAPQELIMAGSAAAPSVRTLLGEQTADSLIRNVWAVYRRHVLRNGLIFVLPVHQHVALAILVGYVWVYVRLIFAATVVALEERTARVAIRRSWGLTRGQFWRLFGLLMLTAVVFLVVALPLFVVGIGVGSLASSDLLAETLVWLPLIVLVAPAVSIAVVLLY